MLPQHADEFSTRSISLRGHISMFHAWGIAAIVHACRIGKAWMSRAAYENSLSPHLCSEAEHQQHGCLTSEQHAHRALRSML